MKFVMTLMVALAAVSARAAEPSLYDFDARFTDQAGQHVTLEQIGRGHPVLISMFYGTCPMACPLLINRIQRIERELPAVERGRLRVVLVTFDPKRDDVAELQAIAQMHHLDASWELLRADASTVRELAAILGIKYRALPDGSFNHSSVITAVAPNGSMRARMDGLDQPEEPVLAAIHDSAAH